MLVWTINCVIQDCGKICYKININIDKKLIVHIIV
jgi:hypothetical protein